MTRRSPRHRARSRFCPALTQQPKPSVPKPPAAAPSTAPATGQPPPPVAPSRPSLGAPAASSGIDAFHGAACGIGPGALNAPAALCDRTEAAGSHTRSGSRSCSRTGTERGAGTKARTTGCRTKLAVRGGTTLNARPDGTSSVECRDTHRSCRLKQPVYPQLGSDLAIAAGRLPSLPDQRRNLTKPAGCWTGSTRCINRRRRRSASFLRRRSRQPTRLACPGPGRPVRPRLNRFNPRPGRPVSR